jgi:3-oxoacyl-[acyl-carrier-protein] synthase-3
MRRARIAGTGLYVPPTLITNQQLSEMMGKPVPESIEGKLGIKQRYITGDDLSSADLGTEAAKKAIADAGIKPEDLDLVIVTTDTPEYISPATAAVVQGRIGAVNAGTFDLNASCAGFVTALDVGSRMIGYDAYMNNILVCGVYNMTKYVDWSNEKTAPIFADGGGAVVLQAAEGDRGFLSSKLYADGTQYDLLGIYAGGTKKPVTKEIIENKEHLLTFLKPLPADRNIKLWPQIIPQALERAGLTIKDVDHFFLTQINRWVIEEVMKIFELPMEKTTCIMDKYGYTGSACIPMALDDARKAGRVKEGDIIAMVGSGVGLSVACAVFRL